MSLNIESEFNKDKNIWVFRPDGDLDIYTSSQFKEEVLVNLDNRESDIVIDGENLNYIDSTGLGALISILRTMKEKDMKIFIENVKPNIRKIFDITDLDKLFIFRGEENE